MKKLFLLWLVSLLLMGCSQEYSASMPTDEAEETVEVTALTNSETLSDQEKLILPQENQTVQVIFTQAALSQISKDLDDPSSQDKFLKIKPAID